MSWSVGRFDVDSFTAERLGGFVRLAGPPLASRPDDETGSGSGKLDLTLRAIFSPKVLAAVLAAVVVTAAVWGIGALVAARRASQTDGRLRQALAATQLLATQRQAQASARASALAGSPLVQAAVASADTNALAQIARRQKNLVFFLHGRRIGAELAPASVRAAIDMFSGGNRLGRLVVAVPLDVSFLRDVRRRSDLRRDDLAMVAVGGRVVVGPDLGLSVPVDGRPKTIELPSGRYRAIAETVADGSRRVQVAALGPYGGNPVGAALLAEAAALGLLLVLAIGALLGKSSIRWRHERRRNAAEAPVATVRDAVALVGDTLAATHNPQALLPVILAAAIEATGSIGGQLVEGEEVVAEQGQIAPSAASLVLHLGEAGDAMRLVLFPAGRFPDQSVEAARWFAEQASIALDNARLHRIVERQAITDDLTGLANRRSFIARLTSETSRADRFGGELVLVVADIDDFKLVNDRFGHRAGDLVLKEFGRILGRSVREVDLPVRLGGEEFALLLPETDLDGGVHLAERIRARLERARVRVERREIAVTASFGVASYTEGVSGEDLLAEADACMYQAKARGKNTIVSAPAHQRKTQ